MRTCLAMGTLPCITVRVLAMCWPACRRLLGRSTDTTDIVHLCISMLEIGGDRLRLFPFSRPTQLFFENTLLVGGAYLSIVACHQDLFGFAALPLSEECYFPQ